MKIIITEQQLDDLMLTLNEKKSIKLNEAENYRLETYGDLKKAINVIKLKDKASKIGGVAIDTLIGATPVLGTAKTAYDFLKAMMSKPDNKKTNTWLDRLDIDDEMSAIVDDTVEQGFMAYMLKKINSTPDERMLEANFNMNDELSEYLKQEYNNRTLIGYKKTI